MILKISIIVYVLVMISILIIQPDFIYDSENDELDVLKLVLISVILAILLFFISTVSYKLIN